MTDDTTKLAQLLEAVAKDPGSPAFIELVEHYLEQGQLATAVQVGQAGYQANRGDDRAAAAYVTALHRAGERTTADDVYQRFVARHPRSVKLKVARAMALLHLQEEREARELASEAVALDPTDHQAWTLLALLELKSPASRQQDRTLPRDADERLDPEQVERVVAGLKVSAGTSPGGTTEVGQDEFEGVVDALRLRDGLSPVASGDRSGQVSEGAPGVRSRRTKIIAPIPSTDLRRRLPTTRKRAERTSRLTASPAAGVSSADVSSADVSSADVSAAEEPAAAGQQPSGVPTCTEDGSNAAAQVPPQGSAGRPVASRPAEPAASAVAAAAPTRRRRTGRPVTYRIAPHRGRSQIWAAWALVPLGVIAVVGVLLLRRQDAQAPLPRVTAALESTATDRREDYNRARTTLKQLLHTHDDPRAHGALALVEAHLWARFGEGRRDAIAARIGRGEGADYARLARALLLLHEAKIEQAADLLKAVPARAGGWHRRFIVLRLTVARAQIASARQLALEESRRRRPAVAILLKGAGLFRSGGDLETSARLIKAGLKAGPGHAGLRIERALLAARRGGSTRRDTPFRPAPTVSVADQVGRAPRYRAQIALLKAYLARAAGKTEQAVAHADNAHRIDPDEPDAAWQAAMWRLSPGGSVAEAVARFERAAPLMERHRPDARLWQARALLLAGRAEEARSWLARTRDGQLPGDARRLKQALAVRCARQLGDSKAVAALCGQAASGGLQLQVACAEAHLEAGRIELPDAVVQQISDPASRAYLEALRALAQRRASSAIRLLGQAERLPDPAARALALARAHEQQNKPRLALKTLRRAVVADAWSARSRLALASSLLNAGHETEARLQLVGLLASRPTDPALLVAVGEALLGLAELRRAQEVVRALQPRAATSVAAAMLAGKVALAGGQLERAQGLFASALHRRPGSAAALVYLGHIAATRGDLLQSRSFFARAVKQHPSDIRQRLSVARAYALAGRYEEAFASGQGAIRLVQGSGQLGALTPVVISLGRSLRAGNRWARARAKDLLLELCLARDAPALAFAEFGRVLLRDDPAGAVWAFRQAVKRDPALASAYRDLSQALETKTRWKRQAAEAMAEFHRLERQARAHAPLHPGAGQRR